MSAGGAPMQVLEGLGVSPGIAIGTAVCLRTRIAEVYRLPLADSEVGTEVERFRVATRQAQEEIVRIRDKVHEQLGEELGAIFDAHALFLEDPIFLDRIIRRIEVEKVNAEWAVYCTAEEMAEQFAAIENDYLKERHEDLRDVAHQLLRSLQGVSHHNLSEIEGNVIIVADELTPSYALRLGREQVVGFVTESGGPTSHTSIIARSLNLPAVSGIERLHSQVSDDVLLILDGEAGTVVLDPTAEVVEQYRSRQRDLVARERKALATRSLEARTADGVRVHLMANIDLGEEIETAVRYGAAGFGLYRSEFLYIERSPALPTEDEHVALYRRLAEAAAPHPAIIRTYDLGGRKLAQELMRVEEENPVLGLRGIRLTLARPELFRTQLRALYRAAVFGDIWVMAPMVSTLEEVRALRRVTAQVCAELEAEGLAYRADLKLGIMIEVPSAALVADRLAREVDFFSIGTNDLIQYALAVDRNNEHVAALYQPLHPALLRLLSMTVEAARAAGIEVSICGEMASDPQLAALLVGLGVRRLSMSPRALPQIKTYLRSVACEDLQRLAAGCQKLDTAGEVEACLRAGLEAAMAAPLSQSATGGQ